VDGEKSICTRKHGLGRNRSAGEKINDRVDQTGLPAS
jgi:hypothetical protein